MKQDPFTPEQLPVVVPPLESAGAPLRFVMWLVPLKAHVIPGERLAELLTQGIVFQLEAPVEGVLTEKLVHPGQVVRVGETVGTIQLSGAGSTDISSSSR